MQGRTTKSKVFQFENPQKCSAFQRKVGKMAKIVTAFLEENDAFSWVIVPKNGVVKFCRRKK